MTINTQKLRERAGKLTPPHLDIAMLLLGAADAFDTQTAEIARLREALTAIEQWEVPFVESRGEAVSMSVAYGSNGVRDYFRGVARAALQESGHD